MQVDLFEHWQTLPETMQNVLNKYAEIEHDYTTLEAMQQECEALGYTFDFGLDCVPYDLRKLNIKEISVQKTELLTKVSELVKSKRDLYGKIDIAQPKSNEEKHLDLQIAAIYSKINQLVKLKRTWKR